MRRPLGRAALAACAFIAAAVTLVAAPPTRPVAADGCQIYNGVTRVVADPCPTDLPLPTCTTYDDFTGECVFWLQFFPNGTTQRIHECAKDELQWALVIRVAATPPDAGPFCIGPPQYGIGPEEITPIWPNLPSDAAAVLANLTMVNGATWGYITADECASINSGPQSTSSGNHDQYVAIANLAVSPIGDDGRFCVFNQRRLDLAVDIQGYFAAPAANGLMFLPSAPTRVLDTRTAPTGRPAAGAITRVQTKLAGVTAALVNITMVDGALPGYVTADRCSALSSGSQTKSNGNYPVSTAIANLSVVNVDADGSFCIYGHTAVDLVVDVQGSFSPASSTSMPVSTSGLGFELISPTRLFDSRTVSPLRVAANSVTRIDTGVPAGTTAVLVNLAMVDGAYAGYITAEPCSMMTPGLQSSSNGNFPRGAPISNVSVVPLDPDGAFCIYNNVATHFVVDLQGAFAKAAPLRFFALPPSRVFDSRNR